MTTAQQETIEGTETGKKTTMALVAVFLTYFVYSYFFQILLAAFPKMAADLDGMSLYSWGVAIPSLGLAFSMLITGKLSDLYGRRAVLIGLLAVCLLGAFWCAFASNFVMLIIARTFLSIGQGGLAPLCFSVLGDMYEGGERSRWIGLLNIPAGGFALIGPTLGGWFTDHLSWRYIFWCGAPLLVLSLLMVLFCLPSRSQRTKPRIDSTGALLAAIASSTMILAFSMAGSMYPWMSKQVLGLLGVSIIVWVIFIRAEKGAEEPIMDLQVLKNRAFITLSSAGLFSAFGLVGLAYYYPLLMEGVQGVTTTGTGQIMTPGNVLMNFLGVPTGFILARTKRYKWIFISSYALTLAIMIFLTFFNASTPVSWGFMAFTLAGLGMGSIPTLNTLVAQYAVPKRLLGVAMGTLYFSVMIGQALAPAILGSAMNMTYNSTLQKSLPAEVTQLADQATMKSLGNSRVLLSESGMETLRKSINKISSNGPAVLQQTVSAIRLSLEASLRMVFIIGAIAMLLTFLIILTIPEISIDAKVEDKKAP
ncbi:MAG TPA: MFS transporter [Acidobacteriota bacterium]|nr:MFS transporter [Acidobacteriota bacterium]